MADPQLVPQTDPRAKGLYTSEGRAATVAMVMSVLSMVVPTLVTFFTDLQAKFPQWSWVAPILGVLGLVGTVLTSLGYGKQRTAVKLALIQGGK